MSRLPLAILIPLFLATNALGEVSYNRDVRPILADACFNCHGIDPNARKAKLRLDTPEGAQLERDGVAAIVPGKPDESELIYRILTDDEDEQMPPPDHSLQLTEAQMDTLRQWVAEGAEYEGHWAFGRVEKPDVPEVDGAWEGSPNPIDAFILRRVVAAGLAPNPEASRETLIRRLSLDLTGLPPTPDEVQQFVSEKSPVAYGQLVDRLLASPRFGERMAMWWLDGARYADSHGFQADWERYQWPWRDWVIKAFNENKHFDEFTVEQLAGDMIPGATTDQIVATGFNRNHRINTEGGSLDAEWLIENVMDRVETAGSVWLGLTMNCARCHDHKYDPISQKEFYQMFAYFHNVPEQGKGPGKQGNFEPTIQVANAGKGAEVAKLDADIATARAQVAKLEKAYADKASEVTGWKVASDLEITSRGGATFSAQGDGSFLAGGKNPETDSYVVKLKPGAGKLSAVVIEALPDPSFANKSVGRATNGNFVLTGVRVAKTKGTDIKIAGARANYEQANWAVAGAIDGNPKTGWAVDGNTRFKSSAALFEFAEPIAMAGGEPLSLLLEFKAFSKHSIGRLRVSTTGEASPALPGQKAVPAPVKKVQDLVANLEKRKAGLNKSAPTVMVMREMDKPRQTFVLNRGQYDQPGEKVGPGLPEAFPPLPEGAPNNRLGFAQWVVARDNPLTSRVQVNRFWELLFGNGLVKSSENFGTQADPPSHPELLDWLAAEFMESGWDVKALLKTIVTSQTYRQSSAVSPTKLEKDPDNELLSRGPRFRVQAETVRDSALYVSGLLKEKLGGPSVYPYQPPGIWSEFNFYGNLRNYKHAVDDGLYRRSLYTIWKRTAAPPAMTLFDMPGREICTVKRSRTNTPLQALALMNDVTYVEASRALAERMIAEGGSDLKSRIAYGFKMALSRDASEEELRVLGLGYQRRLQRFKAEPEAAEKLINLGESKPGAGLDPAQLAALTTVASVILNLDETITKE